MEKRERAEVSHPKCPHCGEPDAARLHDGPDVFNWQCKSLKCLKEFQTPRKGVSISAMVAEEKRRRAMGAQEVAAMASESNECGKCGRVIKTAWYRRSHEKKCKGKGGAEEKPARKAKLRRAAAKPGRNGAGGAFELALAPLRTRREEILAGIPELAEIDTAIAAIEKCRGGGVSLKTLCSAVPRAA